MYGTLNYLRFNLLFQLKQCVNVHPKVTVKLHHWKTAMDSVREEEERARAAMEPKGMGSKVGSKVDLTSRKNSVKP